MLMIQQPSINKTIIILLVLIGYICPVKSQNVVKISPDTIVINETQVVYDTIFVYDTIRISKPKPINDISNQFLNDADTLSQIKVPQNDALLKTDSAIIDKKNRKKQAIEKPLMPLSCKVLPLEDENHSTQPEKIFRDSTATNFKKNIISVKNNTKLMKSEKHSTSQTPKYRWGISSGGGGWRAQSSDGNLQTNILFTPHIGVYFEKKLIQNLLLQMELNYKWNPIKGIQINWNNFEEFIQPPSTEGVKESEIFSWYVNGETEDEFNLSQIDIPLKLAYKIRNFQPCIGFVYTRRFNADNGNYFNVTAGLDIHISKKISLGFSYSYGMREEIQRNGQVMGIVVGNIITLPESKVMFTAYPPEEYLSKNSGELSSRYFDISLYFNLQSN